MLTNTGIVLEHEMVLALNNKKYCELSNNLKHFVKSLFGPQKDDVIVHASRTEISMKPDIFVEIDGVKKYVSLKTGEAKIVHEEQIKPFILFLRSLDISRKTQGIILKFHYGDGTKDGTGSKRLEGLKVYEEYNDEIKYANEELNKNIDIVLKVVDRCIFDGAHEEYIPAEFIYHGDVEYGNVIDRHLVHEYVKNTSFKHYDALHIGPIIIKPHARYAHSDIKSEWRRNQVDCTRPYIGPKINAIAKRYNNLYTENPNKKEDEDEENQEKEMIK